jgi:GDPmannose 4,6-dehydratase
VKVSFDIPEYTGDVDGLGALRILEAIGEAGLAKKTRFYQASSSEMYGMAREVPQTEETPFYPRSPYGAAKAYGHFITVNYRESYDLFTTSGILFNHESPRRSRTFVTRKITSGVSEIVKGTRKKLYLGNLDAIRDWGYAKEYVESMWLMLQKEQSSDYVVATGVGATVRDFADAAFSRAGLNWQDHIEVDQKYVRPTEVEALIGDPTKAHQELGWKAKMHWKELAELMVDADIEAKRTNGH